MIAIPACPQECLRAKKLINENKCLRNTRAWTFVVVHIAGARDRAFASRHGIRDHAAMTQRAEIQSIEALEDFAEFAYAHEWTDGLPVFPPTKKAVRAILDYLQRDPQEELGAIFPGDGIATIENVAANCAMAGCLPQYVPVVIAAVQCMADPALLITTTQSTGSASLCTILQNKHLDAVGYDQV